MFAQVVFDLSLEGVFDYLIPTNLENKVSIGARVQVSFGPLKRVGLVVGLSNTSTIENLKPIKSVVDEKPLLDQAQMALGHDMSQYYGCSLGEALFSIVRGASVIARSEATKQSNKISTLPAVARNDTSDNKPVLHIVPSGNYEQVLVSLIKPHAQQSRKILILVPDQFVSTSIDKILTQHFKPHNYELGTRSSVFRSLADIALVIMIDEENSSFKQEQSPMYETRDVLLMRLTRESVEVAFVSTASSVPMMHLVSNQKVLLKQHPPQGIVKPQVIDLNNYKMIWRGLLSPAVLSSLESNVVKGLKSILVFNHRGSFALTRCEDCSVILKCERCDSPMLYSRIKKQYLCRHCPFSLPGDTVCPKCRKPSWKSLGYGIETLQKALQEKFPASKVLSFERGVVSSIGNFDVLIGTVALLRFKGELKANTIALLDIDSELNRLDTNSCFRAFSQAVSFRTMALKQFFIQSRLLDHYVIKALSSDDVDIFYREDMAIRRELHVNPFGHQVMVQLRGKVKASVEKTTQGIYESLVSNTVKEIQVHAPQSEVVANKRQQYRLNIQVQGPEVIGMITLIKASLSQMKRRGGGIIVLNVDP